VHVGGAGDLGDEGGELAGVGVGGVFAAEMSGARKKKVVSGWRSASTRRRRLT
jgi:hypothetical protein